MGQIATGSINKVSDWFDCRLLERVPLLHLPRMPWLRRILKVGPLGLFADHDGGYYLRWAAGPFHRLV